MDLHQPHWVYVKEKWADDWVLMPQLFCDRCDFTLAPEMPEAVFSYRYGRVMGYGENAFQQRSKLELGDYYVKVEIAQSFGANREWYGVILDDSTDRQGDGAAHVLSSGRQTLIARGLEYLLHRQPITSSVVRGQDGANKTVAMALGFNLGGGQFSDVVEIPNCDFGDDGIPVFCKNLTDAFVKEWTVLDIFHYIGARHKLRDADGTVKIPTQTIAGEAAALMESQKLSFHCHGMTYKQVMDKICDRRRLLSWRVKVIAGIVVVLPVTFNTGLIPLPDGTFAAGNPNVVDWYFEDDAQVKSTTVAETSATRFTRVTTQGEQVTGTFTLTYPTIEEDWKTAQKTAYVDAATAWAGYAALGDYERMHANQRARMADELQKVWRYFRIKNTWDGKIGAALTCPSMADETKQASFWFPGLRLLPRLPLKTETNYADLESVTSNTKDASVAEYRRPFVIHEEYISGGDPRYAFLERRGKGHDLGEVAEAGERQWAATVRVQDNQPGVIVDVHGAPQHVLASADFTSPDDTDAADFQPEISWKNCRFTVCAEFHEFAQASFPPGDNSVGDAENTLLIRVPHKRCDYLVEGTAVDVDSEGELVLSGGGWIQDDRPQLKQIAKAAYEWYNTPRASVEIEKHNLDCAFPSAPGGALVAFDVGYVVSGIGTGANQKQVNAIINKISFNLRAGILNVSTSFAEFDFARGLS